MNKNLVRTVEKFIWNLYLVLGIKKVSVFSNLNLVTTAFKVNAKTYKERGKREEKKKQFSLIICKVHIKYIHLTPGGIFCSLFLRKYA